MSRRLVDDRCFVGSVVNRDHGVNAVTVNNFLFDDWLSHVVYVVVNVFVYFLTKVDNGAFLSSVYFFIAMLGGKTLEELTVFGSGRVTFLDLGNWDSVFVENFRLDLLVNDWLNMMLYVVNVLVNIADTFDFFDFDMTMILVHNMLQMLVVMSDVRCGRVEFGGDRVVVTGSVVETRNSRGRST